MSELQYILFLTFTGLFALQYKQQLFVLFLKFLLELQKNKFFFKRSWQISWHSLHIFRILHGLAAAGCPTGPPRLPLRVLHHGPECHCSRGLQRSCQEVRQFSWIKNSGIDTQRTLVFSYSAILPGPAYSVLLRVNGVQILYISV